MHTEFITCRLSPGIGEHQGALTFIGGIPCSVSPRMPTSQPAMTSLTPTCTLEPFQISTGKALPTTGCWIRKAQKLLGSKQVAHCCGLRCLIPPGHAFGNVSREAGRPPIVVRLHAWIDPVVETLGQAHLEGEGPAALVARVKDRVVGRQAALVVAPAKTQADYHRMRHNSYS